MENSLEFVDVGPIQPVCLRCNQGEVIDELQAVNYSLEGIEPP
jgi:hypothetical protein